MLNISIEIYLWNNISLLRDSWRNVSPTASKAFILFLRQVQKLTNSKNNHSNTCFNKVEICNTVKELGETYINISYSLKQNPPIPKHTKIKSKIILREFIRIGEY